jgi:hypothetical protein
MREGGQDAVMGITWAEHISMRIASPKFSVADNDHVGGIARAAPFQGDDITLNSQDIEKSKNAKPTVTRKVADQQYDDGASSCPIASTGGCAISTHPRRRMPHLRRRRGGVRVVFRRTLSGHRARR